MMYLYYMQGQKGNQLSRPLLEAACRQGWGLSPLPEISKNQWGKPSFSPPEYANYHYNLSHSGEIALCCLSHSPVGLDFQLPRPSRTAFLNRLCSPSERRWLLDYGDSQEAFALLWAMKESFCKYTGRGITLPLSNIITPLPDALPSGDSWLYYFQDDFIFSVRKFQGGFVAVCGVEPALGEIVSLG